MEYDISGLELLTALRTPVDEDLIDHQSPSENELFASHIEAVSEFQYLQDGQKGVSTESWNPVESGELQSDDLNVLLDYIEAMEGSRCVNSDHEQSGSTISGPTSGDEIDSDGTIQPCKVCFCQPGCRFKFYGCKGVCSSCRSFFRRSVQSGQYRIFECRSIGCLIDSKNRMSCKKCRFQRCLSVGMQIAWVHLSEKLEVPKRSKKVIGVDPGVNSSLSFYFTHEEKAYAEKLDNLFYDTLIENYMTIFAVESAYFRNWTEICHRQVHFPYNVLKYMEGIDTKSFIACACNVLSLEDLGQDEQSAIIRQNLEKFVAYMNAAYCLPNDSIDFSSRLVSFAQRNRQNPSVSCVIDIVSEFGINFGHINPTYNKLFQSPWAPDINIEREHFKVTQFIKKWSISSLDGKPDKIQMLLFEMVMMFTIDHTKIKSSQRAKIDRLQSKFLLLLQRYLKYRYPKHYNLKLANGMMVLQHAERLQKMHFQRLPI